MEAVHVAATEKLDAPTQVRNRNLQFEIEYHANQTKPNQNYSFNDLILKGCTKYRSLTT